MRMSRPNSPVMALSASTSTLAVRSVAAARIGTPLASTSPALPRFTADPMASVATACAPPVPQPAAEFQCCSASAPDHSLVGVVDDPSVAEMIESDEYRHLSQPSSETFAHKLHGVFKLASVPTGVIIGLFLIALLFEEKVEAHFIGRIISLYCALMACCMTMLLIYLHLSAYTNPPQQRYIIRILLMVPIYAVDSCLAIWDHKLAPIIGLARDCYESYVIYNFFYLLMSYLGGEEQALSSRLGAKIRHVFPLCWAPPFALTARTLRLWKLLLVQYMLLKPILAIIAMLLTPGGAYDETSWSFANVHVWFVIILNLSVTVAFTSLLYFFLEFKDLLADHQPMGKFAAVKAVVFLSFWQGVLMGILVHVGVIRGSREGLWKSEEVSTGLQDFLVCIEMVIICHVHHRVFPETPYVPLYGHRAVQPWVWRHALSVTDVVDDSVATVGQIADTVRDEPESAKDV